MQALSVKRSCSGLGYSSILYFCLTHLLVRNKSSFVWRSIRPEYRLVPRKKESLILKARNGQVNCWRMYCLACLARPFMVMPYLSRSWSLGHCAEYALLLGRLVRDDSRCLLAKACEPDEEGEWHQKFENWKSAYQHYKDNYPVSLFAPYSRLESLELSKDYFP